MPHADVVVVGAGLSGLTAAIALADAGAAVEVVARGHAATHWTAGGFDVAAPDGASTPADGVRLLAARARPRHPYARLRDDVADSLAAIRSVLASEGLEYLGELHDPLRAVPTSIGGTRQAAILPTGQAAALVPWAPGERLVVCGVAGFKDFWPEAMSTSLRRPEIWGAERAVDARSSRIDAVVVELPDQSGRHNLNALELARRFDDPAWRSEALGRIADAIARSGRPGAGRIAFPAVLGLNDHAAVLDEARRILPMPIFEVPLLPPSIPGLRLYHALRSALRRRGGRLVIGEPVASVIVERRRVTAVAMSAAIRERLIRTDALVLATGGIAGGGLIGEPDGRLVEPLLRLPVESAPAADWLSVDPFDRAGHPLEAAGIRTDAELRPLDAGGKVVLENVAIVGSLLAGQRYLVERCGDGVAIASGRRAAAVLSRSAAAAAPAKARVPA